MANAAPTVRVEPNMQLDEETWRGLRAHTQEVLKDFQRLGAKQVNLRLNESEREDPLPVFLDWLALPGISAKIAKRSPQTDIGRYRLGETTPSKVYNDGIAQALKQIIERDWTCDLLLKEKRVESKLVVQKAGLMYQTFIGIIAEVNGNWRRVGLLTVSFEKKPKKADLDEVKKKLHNWASWPADPKSTPVKSKLVDYLEEVFILGGPLLIKRA